MLACKHCESQNRLDGKFCHECGQPLPQDELALARTENEALVVEGFKLLAESRYPEAMMVAETALASDPGHAQAHALKGDIFEREGDLHAAIAAYERVVEFAPNSTIDRIKLTHLKSVMLERNQIASPPPKRTAIAAAVSATLLVACLGTAAAIFNNSTRSVAKTGSEITNVSTNLPAGPSPLVTPTNPNQNAAANPEQKPAENSATAGQATPPPVTQPNPIRTDAPSSGPRPNLDGELEPMRPNVSALPETNSSAAQQRPSADPDPRPSTGSSSANTNNSSTTTQAPTGPRAIIDIRPSAGGTGGRQGGSEPVNPNTAPPTSSAVKLARDAMIAGNLEQAVTFFQQALGEGADPGVNNQQLGSCLERLGRKAEAIRAYTQARDVFKRRMDAGDSSSRTKGAYEACQQALANLGA